MKLKLGTRLPYLKLGQQQAQGAPTPTPTPTPSAATAWLNGSSYLVYICKADGVLRPVTQII